MIPRYRSPFGFGEVLRASLRRTHLPELDSIPGIPHRKFIRLMPSASDALYVLLRGLEAPGRVILPAYTCMRVVEAVRSAGWSPVYVDINPTSGAMDPIGVADFLSMGTESTVVLATHLHGIPTSIDEILELTANAGVRVIEDCAMAHGAMRAGALVGSFGDAAIFSFGLGKVLSAGAGGALASDAWMPPMPTDTADTSWSSLLEVLSRTGIAGDIRLLVQDAIKRWMPSTAVTSISEMSSFEPTRWSDAAEATLTQLVSLASLENGFERQRKRSERWYRFVLSLAGGSIATFRVAPGDRPCYPGLPLLVDDRDGLQRALRAHGIDTARFFDYCAAVRDGAPGSFPNSEGVARRILILPLGPAIDANSEKIETLLARYARDG